MNLKTYIERGEQAAGSQKALAEYLGQDAGNLRGAKAGIKGLPVAVCYKLAKLIGEDERRVVAASELVTEKKPERRAVLLPFVGHALSVILTAVILIMTPAPSEAAPMAKSLNQHCILCKVEDSALSINIQSVANPMFLTYQG